MWVSTRSVYGFRASGCEAQGFEFRAFFVGFLRAGIRVQGFLGLGGFRV